MGMKSSAYIGTMISLRFFKSLNSVWAKVKSIYKNPVHKWALWIRCNIDGHI